MESKIDQVFEKFKTQTGQKDYNDFLLYLAKKGLESIEIVPIEKNLAAFLALTTYAQIEVLKENKPTGLDKTYWYNQVYSLFTELWDLFPSAAEASLFIPIFRTSLQSLAPHLLPF